MDFKNNTKTTFKSNREQLINTARFAGFWYLLLAFWGILAFTIFHPKIYVLSSSGETLKNLTNYEGIARIRLIIEIVIIVSQALAAVWFYKLFRNINEWAASTIGVWGTVNSIIIIISAISMGAAIDIANGTSLTFQEKIVSIQLLTSLITHSWSIGGLFFGLWLIPMGYIIITYKVMPTWLGRILVISGVGYLLQTFIKYIGFESQYLDILILPAIVGELWMVCYLLIYGIRPLVNKPN